MQYKKRIVSIILLLGLGLTSLQAQESVNVTGGKASGSEGTVNYSVGQIVYQTHTGTTGSVTEGVQQPYEISVVSAIEDIEEINLSVSAYPNPTANHLTLSIDASATISIQSMSYLLFDINGKLLQNEKITNNRVRINMSNLVSSTYFIKIIQNQKEIKTFKILKTE